MSDGTIGRRYARALALSLGEDAKEDALRKVEVELGSLAELMQQRSGNTDFRHAMLNPSFDDESRRKILDDVCKTHKFSETTRRLLSLLVDKERVMFLPQIARAFATEVDERVGAVRAHITSARVLDDKQVKDIVAALEKTTGKRVIPELEVEPEIIGGVAARVGGMVFDNSVKSQLDRMRHALSG